MSFIRFTGIIATVYILYYLVVLLLDLLTQNKGVLSNEGATVHYDLGAEESPIRVAIAQTDGATHSPREEKNNTEWEASQQEQATPEVAGEKNLKSLGVDLGLETLSPEGLEVAKEELQHITKHKPHL